MKYRNLFIVLLVGLVTLFTTTVTAGENGFRKERIKDMLALNEKMEIVIEEVYYRKEKISKVEEGQEIVINTEELKNMLLNNAIVVSGEQINYWFGYETVIISGEIIIDKDTYFFRYNLAGFGTIFLTDAEYIQYGDMTKFIDEQF